MTSSVRGAPPICAVCNRMILGRWVPYLKPDPWWLHSGKKFLSLQAHPECVSREPDLRPAA